MRWDDFRRSANVEDRRGSGGSLGLPGRAGGLGIGAIIILGLIGWATGIDPRILIGGAEILTGGQSRYEAPAHPSPSGQTRAPYDQLGQFVSAVLGDTEDRWKEIFQGMGRRYVEPKLVIYSGLTRSACGTAQSAMGPFYCPNDQRVYLDTSFFRDLEQRFRGCAGRACQFAQAYVIAHEIGHHIQNQLGILPKVQELQQRRGQPAANQLQVMVELQADCLAGVWAHNSQEKWKFIEPGDVEDAMQTASAIGDDRLQKQSQGRVAPDTFTHGSSAQRVRWFTTGLREGTVSSCNTFEAPSL
jgi:predicted metalloprotease